MDPCSHYQKRKMSTGARNRSPFLSSSYLGLSLCFSFIFLLFISPESN